MGTFIWKNGDPIDRLKFGTNNGTIDDVEMYRNLYRNEVSSSVRSRNETSGVRRFGRNISRDHPTHPAAGLVLLCLYTQIIYRY